MKPGPSGWVQSSRWHAAVARAAASLQSRGEVLEDLRVPVAWALAERYQDEPNEGLAELVEVMTPLTGL